MKWVESTYNPLAAISAACEQLGVDGFDTKALLQFIVDELKRGGIIVETTDELIVCTKLLIDMKVITNG